MKKLILPIASIFFLMSPFLRAQDDKHPLLTDKLKIEIGMYLPSKNIKIGADGSTPNLDVDFGDTFQLNDNETTVFFKLEWYFTKKWLVSVESFNVKTAHKVTLDQDIVWEDITFEEGSNVRGGVGLNMYRIFFGRCFSRGQNHEFGGGLGIHALNTSAFIEGEIMTSEGNTNFERRSVSALVPLPNIGLWYIYTPNKKWALTARGDWFGITIGDYSGSLWNIAPGVKYQIFKHFGLGFDYRYFLLKANVNKDDWKGEFNMIFKGPLLSIYANFF